jgi:hypothetical protein
MGLITGFLLLGARNGAKTSARYSRAAAANTAQANRLAKKHHTEITAQNAALLKVQSDALHYQRYATDPGYKASVDAAWAVERERQAEVERQRVAKMERDALRRQANLRLAIRASVAIVLAILLPLAWIFVWLPQLAVAKMRSKPVRFSGQQRIADLWSSL